MKLAEMKIGRLMNLGELLTTTVERNPDAWAMSFAGQRYSFRAVQAVVADWSLRLQGRGVQRGDRLALLISNVPAFSVAYFAGLGCGAIVVPLNPLLSDHEITGMLDHCDARLVCLESRFADRMESIRSAGSSCDFVEIATDPLAVAIPDSDPPLPVECHDDRADETAVILYTSGSTGRPKGVELTHRNLVSNAQSVSREKFSTPQQENVLGPGDVGLAALPLSHAFGQTNMQNGLWLGGGMIVYQPRFDADEALELMAGNEVTFFAGVPTMIHGLVASRKQRPDLELKLRYCVCGGAALAKSLKEEFQRCFGFGIQESYGLTETSPMISCQRIDRTGRAGSVGRPIRGVEVRLADEAGKTLPAGQAGEILVRGPNVFRGYHGDAQGTAEAFVGDWFRTGDIGQWDEDGALRIVDRKKEIINRGGYVIYPREIENVLVELEWIDQAVVVGIPDEKYGEQIKAFITLSGDCSTPESDAMIAEIRAFCKKRLAAYKCPRRVEVIAAMPTGSTGKIDRIQLRQRDV